VQFARYTIYGLAFALIIVALGRERLGSNAFLPRVYYQTSLITRWCVYAVYLALAMQINESFAILPALALVRAVSLFTNSLHMYGDRVENHGFFRTYTVAGKDIRGFSRATETDHEGAESGAFIALLTANGEVSINGFDILEEPPAELQLEDRRNIDCLPWSDYRRLRLKDRHTGIVFGVLPVALTVLSDLGIV
jgi:hypothetical protein